MYANSGVLSLCFHLIVPAHVSYQQHKPLQTVTDNWLNTTKPNQHVGQHNAQSNSVRITISLDPFLWYSCQRRHDVFNMDLSKCEAPHV